MPRATPILTNFTAGEISPRLAGRVDLAKYYNGCKTLENMIVHPHGGATRRPGTYYVAEVKDSARKVRLIPFEFSTTQAYALEFGHNYIRFYMDNGQIFDVDSYTKLLIHGDGDDAATDFEDSGYTGHTISANGYAQKDTTFKKFGTGSMQFSGASSTYLSIADHDDWTFGAAAFTIDFWLRIAYPYLDYGGVFEQRVDSSHMFRIHHDPGVTGNQLRFYYKDGTGTYKDIAETSDIAGSWVHVALIRGWGGVANTWAVCLNGEAITTWTDAVTLSNFTGALEIGRYYDDDNLTYQYFMGWIDEFRISKGIARWTANFNPPDRSYPAYGGSSAYEVTTAYTEDELPTLKYAQSADVLYITHPNHPPAKLSRTGHAAWTLEDIDFIDGPYQDEVTAVVESSAVSGQTTLALKGDGTHYLFYDDEDVVFVVGELLTGTTSTATAKIMAVTDWGTEGVLTLAAISGVFQNNEDITDSGTGDATVNGTVGDGYIAYDTEAGGPFQVAEVITGGTSGATGTIRALQDDGADGKMVIEMISAVNFTVGETITGGTSSATGAVTACSRAHGALFVSTDVGAPFGYYETDTWYWLEIKAVVDDITATAIVRDTDIPAGPADASKYRKGTWNTDNNYPSCVSFHEQRLLFAATNAQPQTIWASAAGDYETMTPGVTDSDAFTYAIASDQVNVIRWLKSWKALIPGTVGGEWIMRGAGGDDPITPTNIWIKPETTYGSANVRPIRIGQAVLFLQRQGRKIREFVYNFESDAYVGPDMTLLAEHITEGGILYMDYAQEPDSIIWCIRSDGVLLGMTYMRPQDVVAWHRHTTEGYFESVAVIPGGEGEDQVWVSVRRTIDGSTVRYIEYFTPQLWDEVTDAIYLDSALTYDGAEVTSLSGLDHLEGEEVSILTNKGVHPNETVGTGAISSLDWGVTKAHVGLSYISTLETMGLETGQREGTAQAKTKRIHKATVRLHETIGCEMGPDVDNLDEIPFREPGDAMDELPPLFTGDKTIAFPGGYIKDAHVIVRQTNPLPLTVLSIIPHMATHDE